MRKEFHHDAFICHASEDKDEFVRLLAEELISHSLKIWYDEFTLTVGDNLRRSIDKGLAQSRYGIVVLSPNFFAKEWPQWELDGLVNRELEGEKVILPVWHNVTTEDIKKYSPSLANLVAVSSSKGLNYVINELLKVIHPEKETSLTQGAASENNTLTRPTTVPIGEREKTPLFEIEHDGRGWLCQFEPVESARIIKHDVFVLRLVNNGFGIGKNIQIGIISPTQYDFELLEPTYEEVGESFRRRKTPVRFRRQVNIPAEILTPQIEQFFDIKPAPKQYQVIKISEDLLHSGDSVNYVFKLKLKVPQDSNEIKVNAGVYCLSKASHYRYFGMEIKICKFNIYRKTAELGVEIQKYLEGGKIPVGINVARKPWPPDEPTMNDAKNLGEMNGRIETVSSLLQSKIKTGEFDVFLCHNSEDKLEIKEIGEKLKEVGLLPWLDEWELRPGLPWQEALENEIGQIKSAAVFVGKNGIGPWQKQELNAFLREFVNRGCPVIPVLLLDAPKEPKLPIFLKNMTWIDFRKNERDSIERLIWGITGKRIFDPRLMKIGLTANPNKEHSNTDLLNNEVNISSKDKFRFISNNILSESINIRRKAVKQISELAKDMNLKNILDFWNSPLSSEKIGAAVSIGIHLKLYKYTDKNDDVLKALEEGLSDASSFVRFRIIEAIGNSETLVNRFKGELSTIASQDENDVVKDKAKKILRKNFTIRPQPKVSTYEHNIEFILERFYEPTKKPVDSDWGIRILHPNRPIEKCIILYNNTPLPWWDKSEPYYERRFVLMGGGNVRVPKAIQKEGAEIKVLNGKETLRIEKFEELHFEK